jgi:hypothetical protein
MIMTMFLVIAAMMAGVILYIGDYQHSAKALTLIVERYGINAYGATAMGVALSSLPQLVSTLMGYRFLSDTKSYGYLVVAAVFESADVYSDMWYISNEGLFMRQYWAFINGREIEFIAMGGDASTIVGSFFWSLAIAAAYSWLGIMLLSLGFGLFLDGFEDSVTQFARGYTGVRVALRKAKAAISDAHSDNPTTNGRTARQQAADALNLGNPQRGQRGQS